VQNDLTAKENTPQAEITFETQDDAHNAYLLAEIPLSTGRIQIKKIDTSRMTSSAQFAMDNSSTKSATKIIGKIVSEIDP